MTTITIYLYESHKHKFNWFDRKWLNAWEYVATHLMQFRKGYDGFYIAPDRVYFTTNFDMTEKEYVELISFATFHFNDFLDSKKPMILTGQKGFFSAKTLCVCSQIIATYKLYKEALTTYYEEQKVTLFGDETIDVKPEFKYGCYYKKGEWSSEVNVTNMDELVNDCRHNPPVDQIEQTELI